MAPTHIRIQQRASSEERGCHRVPQISLIWQSGLRGSTPRIFALFEEKQSIRNLTPRGMTLRSRSSTNTRTSERSHAISVPHAFKCKPRLLLPKLQAERKNHTGNSNYASYHATHRRHETAVSCRSMSGASSSSGGDMTGSGAAPAGLEAALLGFCQWFTQLFPLWCVLVAVSGFHAPPLFSWFDSRMISNGLVFIMVCVVSKRRLCSFSLMLIFSSS